MELKAIRDGFGEELAELGKRESRVVVLSGDLEDSTKAAGFKKEFPLRFFNLGISEQDMIGTAAGMSREGFIPFACSFAVFLTNRAYDQIRITVCYNKANVKLVGSHAGISAGSDGATAQCLEDIAIMRALPNMTVICPADALEVKKAVRAAAEYIGPVYIRTARTASEVITKEETPFAIGKAVTLREGKDLAISACGIMVPEALRAAVLLEKAGVDAAVINMATIKPLDKQAVVDAAKKCGCIVTAEEHQRNGGLGSAVAEALLASFPVPVEFVAVNDSFGESGEPEELLSKYGLKDVDIARAGASAVKRKKTC